MDHRELTTRSSRQSLTRSTPTKPVRGQQNSYVQACAYELPGAVVFVAQQHRHSPVALHGRAEIPSGRLHELANAEAAPVTTIKIEGEKVTRQQPTLTSVYQSGSLDYTSVSSGTPVLVRTYLILAV